MDNQENNNKIDIKELENEINKINENLQQEVNELRKNNLKKEIILEELLKVTDND